MILKWLTPQGNWRWIDAVEELTVHGRYTIPEIDERVKIYGGHIEYFRDADAFGVEDKDERALYAMVLIRGHRRHLALHAGDVYVLSDEGKTVDKFYA